MAREDHEHKWAELEAPTLEEFAFYDEGGIHLGYDRQPQDALLMTGTAPKL